MSRVRDYGSNTYPQGDFNHHILSVLVQNRPGVLARVAGLFARRGYNIFSLAVAPTEDPDQSRITIVVDVESAPLEQVTKQLFKLVDVVKISELDPRRSVERELLIATVKSPPDQRSHIAELVNIFEGKIIAVAESVLAGGDADMVSMARPLLADAEFVKKAELGRADEINVCIACNQACLDHTFTGQEVSCLVNPRACRETEPIATAAAPAVPPELVDQLRVGGRLVIPVGPRHAQQLVRLKRTWGKPQTEYLGGCAFVPLIGPQAWPG